MRRNRPRPAATNTPALRPSERARRARSGYDGAGDTGSPIGGAVTGLITTAACLGLIILVAFLSACASPPPLPQQAMTIDPEPVRVAVQVDVNRVTSTVAQTARVEGNLLGPKLGSTQLAAGRDVTVTWAESPPKTMRVAPNKPDESPGFVLDISGIDPGPQSVCIDDACHRVMIAEATRETPEAIEAKIERARDRAFELLEARSGQSPEALLHDFTFAIGGPSSSAGGHFSPSRRTLTINTTSGRSVDEFVTTILHEIGHAMDHDHFDLASRRQFAELRGLPAASAEPSAWLPTGLAPQDRWLSPAEDFAEVFVAWVTNGEHQTRSLLSDQPTTDDLRSFDRLIRDAGL